MAGETKFITWSNGPLVTNTDIGTVNHSGKDVLGNKVIIIVNGD